jgi:hypothetical protein
MWPELVDVDEAKAYPFCQRLGREAHEAGIAGFLTPSARRVGGTNVPVFSRPALTNPRVRALAAFEIDPVAGTVEMKWA